MKIKKTYHYIDANKVVFYALGKDGKIYAWSVEKGEWVLHKST